jgi:phage baseplate assembly protein gpV
MMNAIEVIRQVAIEEVKKLHTLELGVVTSIFPHSSGSDSNNYECNVQLKNRELELRRVPVLTQHIGLTQVPNVGDFVVLAFVQGNINAPVIIGRLYNDENRPPVNDAGESVYESPDSKQSGVRRIHLKFPNNTVIEVTDDKCRVEAGSSKVTIETDGKITIESNSSIEIKASDSITLEATGDLSLSGRNVKIEGQQDLKLSGGSNAELKSNSSTKVSGTTAEIKGSASAKIEGSGMLDVKSSGVVNIQGSLVKIN